MCTIAVYDNNMCSKFGCIPWLCLLLLILCGSPPTQASWLSLSLASVATAPTTDTCNRLPGLVTHQVDVCRHNPHAIFCVAMGARRGIIQCQYQFRNDRWNCSTIHNQTIFDSTLTKGTRETAFIYAVTSAGVVHAVTQSCSAGNLTDCSCDLAIKDTPKEGETWTWGGCSDDIRYGVKFGGQFVDAPEQTGESHKKKGVRPLLNLHNNKLGRRVIQENMRMRCRCHGVSGSCAVKTCWKTMPSFNDIGRILKQKYENSVAVASRSKRKLKRKQKFLRKVPISDDEMVFMDRSPNYCRKDLNKGVMGTKGRECNKQPGSPGSCELLCCGRGYNTQVVRQVERCYCKFYWCCKVKCKLCETMLDKYTCK